MVKTSEHSMSFFFVDPACLFCQVVIMHVNNEQLNTQKMLEHNQAKERVYSGSLQRKLADLINREGGGSNIDVRESSILNAQDYCIDQLKKLFGPSANENVWIESDVDPQLLIKVKFIEKVDCNQIVFNRPRIVSDDQETSFARNVKIFVNRPTIDFSDVSDQIPAEQIELPFEYNDDGRFVVSLLGTKFGRISSIEIFVEDNFGTDKTVLGRIELRGFMTPTYHVEYK
jgi:hypothetical protein